MQRVFITSDTHFGHSNIIKYCNRPFRTIHDMDDALAYNTNNIVCENDILIHCGDFSFGRVEYYRGRIKCKNVILLLGNHDCKRGTTKLNYQYFSKVYPHYQSMERSFYVNNIKYDFLFSHYAYLTYNKSHHGVINCYGHSHSNLEPFFNKIYPNRRSIDVGVDNAYKLLGEYRPFSLEEIIKLVGHKPITPIDHHGK